MACLSADKMMARHGAEAVITELTSQYPETITPGEQADQSSSGESVVTNINMTTSDSGDPDTVSLINSGFRYIFWSW